MGTYLRDDDDKKATGAEPLWKPTPCNRFPGTNQRLGQNGLG